MPAVDTFLELYYGKLFSLDLHGLTLEEAKANLIYTLTTIDSCYTGVLVIHGYHKGRVLKDYIRNKFVYANIKEKINLDAARTIILLK